MSIIATLYSTLSQRLHQICTMCTRCTLFLFQRCGARRAHAQTVLGPWWCVQYGAVLVIAWTLVVHVSTTGKRVHVSTKRNLCTVDIYLELNDTYSPRGRVPRGRVASGHLKRTAERGRLIQYHQNHTLIDH